MSILSTILKLFGVSIPNTRPKITKQELLDKIKVKFPIQSNNLPNFFVVGIRGYYKNSLGNSNKNDRKIYDDAIFLVGKNEFLSFNANTDPNGFKKGIATLVQGIHAVYKFDLHRGQYLALCQRAGSVTVKRDQWQNLDIGNFGINIHSGSYNSTSSLGCQTIPPNQWGEFINKAEELAKKYNGLDYRKKVYTYILIEE